MTHDVQQSILTADMVVSLPQLPFSPSFIQTELYINVSTRRGDKIR